MTSEEIRRRFLQYFMEQGHSIVPSSPVVPHDDPTLLFTNAGMNQFKDVFLAKSRRDYTRATTSQKCIRVGGKHNDLDNVGHTSRHLTFFEMLGNFSFGDYFKEQAIQFAWEVSTKVFEFPPEKIWITVFEKDDEAFSLWQKWVPLHRIVHLGEKDNFWAMGDTGPCGPCSELLFDRGPSYGNASSPKEDVSGERYFEFWNLVFMQFNRDATGNFSPLPKQCIDTGAGLERVASLKMNVDNVFATDILRSLIEEVEKISGIPYKMSSDNAAAFHVIADHIRSLSFAIADGAQPSNIERGYVLRKLIRRAVRYGRSLKMNDPFLAHLLPRLVYLMGGSYPELIASKERIAEILTIEEEGFIRTLKRGGNILSSVIEKALTNPLKQIEGEEAFKLKDTYGFPIEEILLIAKDSGLQVNLEAYELLEEEAKEKSRKSKAVHAQLAQESLFKDYVEAQGACSFVGYQEISARSQVKALIVEGAFVDKIEEGQEAEILLDQTPFYPEKGGQVADIGTISTQDARFIVKDCKSPYPDVIVHIGKMEKGTLSLKESVLTEIDFKRRQKIANHHTATHLLHYALQKVLGSHIRQSGSLVEPERLRFDFNHHKALDSHEIRKIEELVNEKVRQDSPVKVYEISYEEAQKQSDIKQFFGDKYGHKVRVVEAEESKELCGGTHTHRLGTIGLFRILKESSIAAGVRRIEAAVGKDAEAFMYSQEDLALAAAATLRVPVAKLVEKVSFLSEENKKFSGALKNYKRAAIKELALELAKKARRVDDLPLLTALVPLDPEDLIPLSEDLIAALESLVLILACKAEGRCQLFVKVTPDLVQKGLSASAIVKEIASCIGGSGGGKADSAQAGGKLSEGIEQAFQKAEQLLAAWTS